MAQINRVFKILNGVTTFENTSEFVIRIKDQYEDGIFGIAESKNQALHIIQCIGKEELSRLIKTFDLNWNKIDSFYNEKKMTYTITLQQLGRFLNGSVESYFEVSIEEVPKVYQSKYFCNEKTDSPKVYRSIDEELKDHPRTFKG
ncbi:hypothetical protein Indivirus_4_33 [Indivirus ILV1]|uniref:Uncharacterized protein n=1 Tax=Indivirus ILV1 TaxID=1977633 RepID=A0A1V0SDU7_9VIRU|nr:hypothetical protein Indivirus_4_33 [Indivirus ILV1]